MELHVDIGDLVLVRGTPPPGLTPALYGIIGLPRHDGYVAVERVPDGGVVEVREMNAAGQLTRVRHVLMSAIRDADGSTFLQIGDTRRECGAKVHATDIVEVCDLLLQCFTLDRKTPEARAERVLIGAVVAWHRRRMEGRSAGHVAAVLTLGAALDLADAAHNAAQRLSGGK